jgi:hypothetical protein
VALHFSASDPRPQQNQWVMSCTQAQTVEGGFGKFDRRDAAIQRETPAIPISLRTSASPPPAASRGSTAPVGTSPAVLAPDDAGAGPIHSRTSTGTSGSHAWPRSAARRPQTHRQCHFYATPGTCARQAGIEGSLTGLSTSAQSFHMTNTAASNSTIARSSEIPALVSKLLEEYPNRAPAMQSGFLR